MTYILFVNDKYYDSTRNNEEAFRWMKEWEELGFRAGLKFLRDNDAEALRWLIPPQLIEEMRVAA